MNYWWVNQNQTFKEEFQGNYLWSPKRKSNGQMNPFYEFMKGVVPGDIVFSFADTYIKAIGIIQSNAYASPQPIEFGKIGAQWGSVGWKVDVHFILLNNKIRPADHMEKLEPELPNKYSPLQSTGRGNQGVYLTNLPRPLATVLIELIGAEAGNLVDNILSVNDITPEFNLKSTKGLSEWEEDLEDNVRNDILIPETERKSIIMARRGQGVFKKRVALQETHCRITEVNEISHLRASHIKPWRYCEDHTEKLNGNNGLLLTPTVDHLFDRGFISFESAGGILVSPIVESSSLSRMGINLSLKNNVGTFNEEQQYFLEYHRKEVFLS